MVVSRLVIVILQFSYCFYSVCLDVIVLSWNNKSTLDECSIMKYFIWEISFGNISTFYLFFLPKCLIKLNVFEIAMVHINYEFNRITRGKYHEICARCMLLWIVNLRHFHIFVLQSTMVTFELPFLYAVCLISFSIVSFNLFSLRNPSKRVDIGIGHDV